MKRRSYRTCQRARRNSAQGGGFVRDRLPMRGCVDGTGGIRGAHQLLLHCRAGREAREQLAQLFDLLDVPLLLVDVHRHLAHL